MKNVESQLRICHQTMLRRNSTHFYVAAWLGIDSLPVLTTLYHIISVGHLILDLLPSGIGEYVF